MSSTNWSLNQIRKLLPLDDDSLQQILNYSSSLSKDASAEHLKNLLGDSPQALEFISSFNARRQVPVIATPIVVDDGALSAVPKPKQKKKKESAFNKLPPPRQVEGFGDIAGGYIKRRDDNLDPRSRTSHSRNPSSDRSKPSSRNISPAPLLSQASKLPPSASGRLISDPKPKSSSSTTPKSAKVAITGGTPMKGKSTALSDLDLIIRNLEIQTNPTLTPSAEENAKRKCNCMATRHDLLAAAPNCINCGKIICVKEGIGPCTFCNNPLLGPDEIASMIRVLREESGREKMASNNASHKRAEVSKTPQPFSSDPSPTISAPQLDSETDKFAAAKRHRDKLLAFQSQNARRTRIHDEAADFDTPVSGTNVWATPVERAMELKRQQKALREQEWRSKPEWERKRVVASIDLVGGKVVRRMATVERPQTPPDSDQEINVPQAVVLNSKPELGRNPLLGSLIRPIAPIQSTRKELVDRTTKWRRVQDDNDDNERWILDGGLQGASVDDTNNSEEPPCG